MLARLRQRLHQPLSQSVQFLESKLLIRHGLRPILAGSVLVTLFVGGLQQLRGLKRLELMVYDRFTQWELSQSRILSAQRQGLGEPESPTSTHPSDPFTDSRLLVVGITQEDLENQTTWPFSDQTIADVLDILQANGALAIGLDLYRDISHEPGSDALKQQLQEPNVIAITELNDFDQELISPPEAAPPEQVGFNDLVIDRDGVVRRQLLIMHGNEQLYYAFSLLLSQYYLQNLPGEIAPGQSAPHGRLEVSGWEGFTLEDHFFPSLRPNDGGYQDIDNGGWQILLDYQGGNHIAPTISLTDLLEGDFDPQLIQDKIVLIGNVAVSSKDLFETPYSSDSRKETFTMPGVIIHAQMVSQLLRHILDGEPIFRFWPESAEWLWAFAWALAGGGLVWRLKHPLTHGIIGVVSISALSGITWILFTQSIWVPVIFPALTFLTTGTCLIAYKEFFRSFYDPLTGLPNRDRFLKLLEQSMARRQQLKLPQGEHESTAVMFLDLDQFKDINESLGHSNGDQLLLNITRRLKQSLPKQSHIARLGGDEFGIVLSTVQNVDQARSIVDDLQQALAKPVWLQGQEVFPSASVGIALAPVKHHYAAETLLRDAHTATYRAKDQGKARYEVFSKGMRTQVVERFQLERDLHQALEREELFLVYQPFVELTTQRVIGFEALVRWSHPQRGLISPGEFIPMAESSGLIIPMGRWILREACQQMKAWQDQLPSQAGNQPCIISVNLSSEQFTEPNLADQIRHIIQETGINPASLKLELTESMMMGDVEAAIQMLLNLKQLGVKLGLDDFGTGYSSLSYLHRFPIDTLKIDLSFVRHMTEASENAAIVKTIVELGHNLSMDVIAEGVELPEQAAALRKLCCEVGQGYFFSRPLPQEDAERLLMQPPTWEY